MFLQYTSLVLLAILRADLARLARTCAPLTTVTVDLMSPTALSRMKTRYLCFRSVTVTPIDVRLLTVKSIMHQCQSRRPLSTHALRFKYQSFSEAAPSNTPPTSSWNPLPAPFPSRLDLGRRVFRLSTKPCLLSGVIPVGVAALDRYLIDLPTAVLKRIFIRALSFAHIT